MVPSVMGCRSRTEAWAWDSLGFVASGPPMAVYQTRQELIQKLLQEAPPSSAASSASSSHPPPPRQREWESPGAFVDDTLGEVYGKLASLEKQIWGKLVVMEGRRRTAKAYLRHPILTLDGSDAEFDGLRIGLSRFPNPDREEVVYDIFNEMLAGLKIKIDPDGNVWAKRLSESPVFLKPLYRNRPNDLFLVDVKPVKVFDIRRFKEILVDELKQANPDRGRLERCCLVCLKLSVDHAQLLSTPLWVVVVHLVAVELLNLVLPKDRDLSSPSSSFRGHGSPVPDHPVRQPFPTSRQPLPSQELYNTPPRSLGGFGRAERGGVVKRMLQRPPDVHLPHPARLPPPPPMQRVSGLLNERTAFTVTLQGGAYGEPSELGGARSLLDLRQLNQHYAPVYFAGQGRRSERMGSLDVLNFTPKDSSPNSGAIAAAFERQFRLKKWKSQDSGIGSGSYGSK